MKSSFSHLSIGKIGHLNPKVTTKKRRGQKIKVSDLFVSYRAYNFFDPCVC